MNIFVNNRMSGFRKWAEAHSPRMVDEAGTGAMENGVSVVADANPGGKVLDRQPHRPWLVPGVGRL